MASAKESIDHAVNRNTASTTSTAEQISSPFLRLAAELRNRIYEHVFTGTIEIRGVAAIPPESGYGIVLACKQTYAESIALYYSTPTFRFFDYTADDDDHRCVHWSEKIGAEAFSHVTKIEINGLDIGYPPDTLADGAQPHAQIIAFDIAHRVDRSLGILKRRLGVRQSSKVVLKTAIWTPLDPAPNEEFAVWYASTPADTLYAHCVEVHQREREREVRRRREIQDAVGS